MISKQAIHQFKNKKLSNFDWIKTLPKRELLLHTQEYSLQTEPWTHQMACFLLGMKLNSFLFFLDMGTGKTKIIIDILSTRKQQGKLKKTLVVAYNDNAMYTWADEIDKHSDTLSYVCLIGNKKQRQDLLSTEETDIYIVTWAGLRVLFCDIDKTKIAQVKTKKKQRLSMKFVEELFVNFNHLILDESHLVKNPLSLTFSVCKQLAKRSYYKYALTGTPMKDTLDLWSQFYLIDEGETFGTSFSFYREVFFKKKQGYFKDEWILPKINEKLIHTRMKNRSIRYEEDEAGISLPEKIFNIVRFDLSKEQLHDYQNLRKSITTKDYNITEIKNIFIAYRQITSGFLKVSPDEKIYLPYTTNAKLDALFDVILTIPEDRKVIIYNEFIYSGELIEHLLTENNYNYARIYSKTKDKKGEEERFKTDKDCRILIANTKSVGVSLNLQVANYVIYYEMPSSIIQRKQSLKRTHRAGQQHNVFYYDLLANKTVDNKIYESVKADEDIFNKVIDGKLSLKELFLFN